MASDPDPASASPNCLLLADRHLGLLEGIQGLLGSMFATVVTVTNEASLVEGVRLLQPAMAVLDLGLAPDGLGAIRRLRELRPEQKIILLSPHGARAAAEAAFRSGADGYVLKQSIADDLLRGGRNRPRRRTLLLAARGGRWRSRGGPADGTHRGR